MFFNKSVDKTQQLTLFFGRPESVGRDCLLFVHISIVSHLCFYEMPLLPRSLFWTTVVANVANVPVSWKNFNQTLPGSSGYGCNYAITQLQQLAKPTADYGPQGTEARRQSGPKRTAVAQRSHPRRTT